MTTQDTTTNTPSLLLKVRTGFQSLQGSPGELWKAYLLKFFDSYSYFSFSIIFTLFLSGDFGYTDIEAGTIYGAWGALVTIYGLLSGFVVDNLGVSQSLRLGFGLSLVARCMIFITTSRWVFLVSIGVVLPMGNCLGIPVLTTGIRRYTTEANRGFAFGLFYVVMNVAALLSGPVVDICTILFDGNSEQEGGNNGNDGKGGDDDVTTAPLDWSLSGYRLVVLTGIIANVAACAVSFTVREIKVMAEPNTNTDNGNGAGSSNLESTVKRERGDTGEGQQEARISGELGQTTASNSQQTCEFEVIKGTPWEILQETLKSRNFWRFLLVCLITLNVRMIFRHLDATLPKYMIREFGPDVPKGTIYSINPALIIILVPLVTAGTNGMDPLVMIHHGSYVSAASVFFLVASTSVWACALFVIFLSIGESMWSPRLYDYAMSVTREGREGTYMALSSAPLFLAKLPVGFMSGLLLERYCPEEGPRNSKMMWLIIGLTTASSPVLLTIFWKYISNRSEHVDEMVTYTELQEIIADDGLPGPNYEEVNGIRYSVEEKKSSSPRSDAN